MYAVYLYMCAIWPYDAADEIAYAAAKAVDAFAVVVLVAGDVDGAAVCVAHDVAVVVAASIAARCHEHVDGDDENADGDGDAVNDVDGDGDDDDVGHVDVVLSDDMSHVCCQCPCC